MSEFDTSIDRRNTGSLKWDRFADGVLPMWVADMDFASPQCVLEAIRSRVDHEVLGYSRPHPGVTEAVIEYFTRDHGVSIEPDSLVWLPGLVPALSMTCGAVGGIGDVVLTNTPVYPPFLHVHRDFDRKSVKVALAADRDGRYTMDFDALEAAVTPETRVFLLCNPHNPVGRAFDQEELEQLTAFCVRHDLVLCSDEIHCDLVFDNETTPHHTALTFAEELQDRTIVLQAASKTYNIAGLACAFAVIPNADLRRRFIRAGGKLIPEISPLSFHATEAAYRHGRPWQQDLLAYLRANCALLQKRIGEIEGIRMSPMDATYLAWLDVSALGLEDPAKHFESHGIGLSDGRDFGATGFVRLNFGCPRALLSEALDRMATAVQAAPGA